MRVTVSQPSTGLAYFPGLAAPRTVDTTHLEPADAERLASLVGAVAAAPPPPPEPSLRDGAEYVVKVEDGARPSEWRTARPTAAMSELIALVRTLSR